MPEPVLQASFQVTNAELADFIMRRVIRDPALRRQRWLAALGLAAMAAVIALLVLALMPTQSTGLRLALPIGAAVAAGTLFLLHWPRATRRAVARLQQRQHGAGPSHCAVTLAPAGVLRELSGASTELPWSELLRIQHTGTDVEFVQVNGDVLVAVPSRAFTSADERDRFVATATQLQFEASGEIR